MCIDNSDCPSSLCCVDIEEGYGDCGLCPDECKTDDDCPDDEWQRCCAVDGDTNANTCVYCDGVCCGDFYPIDDWIECKDSGPHLDPNYCLDVGGLWVAGGDCSCDDPCDIGDYVVPECDCPTYYHVFLSHGWGG